MRKYVLGSLTAVLFLTLATSAWAQAHHEGFTGIIGPGNVLIGGGGSGWNNGEWINYPQTNWWNQWFYDDPPDPKRYKVIDYTLSLDPQAPGTVTFLDIAINWSTLDFPISGPDGAPPMPDQERYIERGVIFSGGVNSTTVLDGHFIIPDFNPEWVSIDIRYVEGQAPIAVSSSHFVHECVPEPSTFVLLAAAALGMGIFAWRRR
jgi:hypothetical protein